MDWQNIVTQLLTKAENYAVTAEERQALTEKAAYLMAKYGISELLNHPSNTTFNVAHEFFHLTNPHKNHRSLLIGGLARAFNCKAVRLTTQNKLQVFGTPEDLKSMTTLFVSLWIQANLSLASSEKPYGVHGKTHSHSYLLGFINEVISRVKRATGKAQAEASTTSTDLVFAGRDYAVDRAVFEVFPNLTQRRTTSATDSRSYFGGVRAGSMADINQSRMGGSYQQKTLNG